MCAVKEKSELSRAIARPSRALLRLAVSDLTRANTTDVPDPASHDCARRACNSEGPSLNTL